MPHRAVVTLPRDDPDLDALVDCRGGLVVDGLGRCPLGGVSRCAVGVGVGVVCSGGVVVCCQAMGSGCGVFKPVLMRRAARQKVAPQTVMAVGSPSGWR